MLRRFRLRFRKAAAVTALAMGLSVSLVVSTPQNAQAFVPPAAIAGPVVLGAAPAVLGTAATGVLVASGVGLVIMAGVFVMAAHANGVFKFPWEDNPVNTEDGEVTEDIPTETPSGIVETGVGRNIRSTPDMVIGTPFIEGEYLNFPLTYSGEIPLFMGTAYKQVSFMGTLELTCRLPETGEVVKDVRRVFQGTWTNSAAVGNQFGQTRVYKAKCQNFNAVMTDALLRPMTPEEYAAAKSSVDGNGASTFRGPGEESFWKGECTA